MAAAGAVLGLAIAWMLTSMLRTVLFQTPPHDALTFGLVAIVMLGTAIIACYLPARRAAQIDPIDALREE